MTPTPSPSLAADPASSVLGQWPRWALAAGVGIVVGLLPLLLLGPGTDLDAGSVIESGRSILHGDYLASRAPGSPVHEASVGVLEWVGGVALANLGSLAMGVALVVGLVALLQAHGVRRPFAAAAVVVSNPWFLVAATSTVDFVWALAFVVWGARAVTARRHVLGGVLLGLGVGCRMSSLVLVAAVVLAELYGDRTRRRGAFVTAAVAVVVSIVVFLPPFFAAGSSIAFAENDFRTSTPVNLAGRALAKDLYFVGPLAAVALVVALPALARTATTWRSSWLVRFAVAGLVGSQVLFLRFPWKMGHLLPTLVCLAVLLAVALAERPRLLTAIVVAQLIYGVVNVQLFDPDRQNEATGATVGVSVRWGPFVTDTVCRGRDREAWVGNDQERQVAVWDCAKPWGTGP